MKLDEKTKELIAVGASIAARCRPCLEHHSKKALELGSDEEEIAEAIEAGKRVRKAAAAWRPAMTMPFRCCS
jgi:AhpD family alkylhydroperoxidase